MANAIVPPQPGNPAFFAASAPLQQQGATAVAANMNVVLARMENAQRNADRRLQEILMDRMYRLEQERMSMHREDAQAKMDYNHRLVDLMEKFSNFKMVEMAKQFSNNSNMIETMEKEAEASGDAKSAQVAADAKSQMEQELEAKRKEADFWEKIEGAVDASYDPADPMGSLERMNSTRFSIDGVEGEHTISDYIEMAKSNQLDPAVAGRLLNIYGKVADKIVQAIPEAPDNLLKAQAFYDAYKARAASDLFQIKNPTEDQIRASLSDSLARGNGFLNPFTKKDDFGVQAAYDAYVLSVKKADPTSDPRNSFMLDIDKAAGFNVNLAKAKDLSDYVNVRKNLSTTVRETKTGLSMAKAGQKYSPPPDVQETRDDSLTPASSEATKTPKTLKTEDDIWFEKASRETDRQISTLNDLKEKARTPGSPYYFKSIGGDVADTPSFGKFALPSGSSQPSFLNQSNPPSDLFTRGLPSMFQQTPLQTGQQPTPFQPPANPGSWNTHFPTPASPMQPLREQLMGQPVEEQSQAAPSRTPTPQNKQASMVEMFAGQLGMDSLSLYNRVRMAAYDSRTGMLDLGKYNNEVYNMFTQGYAALAADPELPIGPLGEHYAKNFMAPAMMAE